MAARYSREKVDDTPLTKEQRIAKRAAEILGDH
jgi:hypothetical protein